MAEFITGLVETAEKQAGKSIFHFTRNDLIEHYFSQSGISRSSFDLRKSGIIGYLEEIDAYQTLKNVRSIFFRDLTHTHILRLEFFANFDSLIDELEKRIADFSPVIDENLYNSQLTALSLAWVGIESSDVISIKRADVNDVLNTITLNGIVYDIPPRAMPYIVRYRDQDRLIKMSGSGLCEVFMRESPYLFRTTKSNRMSQRVMLAGITTKLNTVDGKRFVYNSVKMSGAFFRVMQYEQSYGRIKEMPSGLPELQRKQYVERMERVFKLPMATEMMLMQRMAQYEAYKDVYHSAE